MFNALIFDPLLTLLIQNMLNLGSGAGILHFHTYQNSHVPAQGDTLSNYTENTYAGYSVLSTSVSDFVLALLANHVAQRTRYAPFQWQLTSGAQQVYGVFVTDSTDSVLLAAAADPSAPMLSTGEPFYILIPSFTLQNAP